MNVGLRRFAVPVLIGALTAGMLAGPAPVTAAEQHHTSRQPDRTVTLLTGDTVTLNDERPAAVTPGAGRSDMGFRQFLELGDLYVIPNDAARLVASGRVDRRLFNVSELVEAGYHDTARSDLPIMVSYADERARSSAPGSLAADVARVARTLPSLGGAAIHAAKASAERLWSTVRKLTGTGKRSTTRTIERVWLDAPVHANLAESVPQIGAPQAWEAGHTGKGSKVAVLDTGVDRTHPDLAGAVVASKNFTDEPDVSDENGHGTHVASTITGDGTAGNGKYQGVAPDTKLVIGKVLDSYGSGSESELIAGMEWAASQAPIVNVSLGTRLPDTGSSPASQAVNRLTKQTGTLFVVAAGNTGPEASTIGSPGSADAALTVGAVTKKDELAEFSSRGPRWSDSAIKPNITAPGKNIVAARAKGTEAGEPAGDGYTKLSGTSMAAPHAAGAAAILAAQHPEWRAGKLKAAMQGSARPHPELGVYQQGAGRLDLARAVNQQVIATPATLNGGTVRWPRPDDKPIHKTLTYHNTGNAPTTLELSTKFRGPDGKAAPEDMLSVKPAKFTIPAGERAKTTVTVDTKAGGPDGVYGGAVTARSTNGATVRTPVGAVQEVESYNVDFRMLDRDGSPTGDYSFRLVSLDKPKAYLPYDKSGSFTARLPKGTYYLEASFAAKKGPSETVTTIVEPAFVVDGSANETLDARDGKPVGIKVDKPTAKTDDATLGFTMETSHGGTGFYQNSSNLDGQYVRPSRTSHETFEFFVEAHKAKPDGEGGFLGSPYAYHLRKQHDRRVPTKLGYQVRNHELARVTATHAASGPKFGKRRVATGRLPFTLTEYYTPGVPWTRNFNQHTSLEGAAGIVPTSYIRGASRTYQHGKHTNERWNAAVFGPAFPNSEPGKPNEWAARHGNVLRFGIPLYTDQGSDHYGKSRVDSGRTVLYRGSDKIGEAKADGEGEFEVPADGATYRLHTESERGNPFLLSTRIEADWTFRSAAGSRPAPLPLLAIRFAPELDEYNQAAAGKPLTLPVSVQRNGTSEPLGPGAAKVRLRASFDDGQSWRDVPLTVDGGRSATITPPAGTKFVSLHAIAQDKNGNRVDQKIIRAYAVR